MIRICGFRLIVRFLHLAGKGCTQAISRSIYHDAFSDKFTIRLSHDARDKNQFKLSTKLRQAQLTYGTSFSLLFCCKKASAVWSCAVKESVTFKSV